MNARTVTLDRKTTRLRARLLKRLEAEPLGRALAAINHMMATIDDEPTRMALLSARILILRRRTEASRRGETPDMGSSLGNIPEPEEDVLAAIEEEIVANEAEASTEEAPEGADEAQPEGGQDWTRLRILEDCVVNGMRFPKGFRVEVLAAEAERLLETGKAELAPDGPGGAEAAEAPEPEGAEPGGAEAGGAEAEGEVSEEAATARAEGAA